MNITLYIDDIPWKSFWVEKWVIELRVVVNTGRTITEDGRNYVFKFRSKDRHHFHLEDVEEMDR